METQHAASLPLQSNSGEQIMRTRIQATLPLLLLFLSSCLVAQSASKTLQVYSIDVEGGQATLIVSPTGQSMLIDTGWPGFDGRDADRIVAATKLAGVQQIDYLVITHYHRDHVGGVPQLADRIKIANFVDHGDNMENADQTRTGYSDYLATISQAHGKRLTVKPGDHVPISGIDVQVLTAARQHISRPLPGGGQPNSLCASEPAQPDDPTENSASLGVLVSYGKFRLLDMGDLTKKAELALVCPNNPLGRVDVFFVTHHGLDQSNSKAFVRAVHPRVAIMNNGAHKGGSPEAWQTVNDTPGVEDLWQLHYAMDSDQKHNSAENLIANVNDAEGNYLKLAAQNDGSFTVQNSRNNFQKSYAAAVLRR